MNVSIKQPSENALSTEATEVEIDCGHGHKLIVRDLETDVAVIMFYPEDIEGHGVCLESIMKEV